MPKVFISVGMHNRLYEDVQLDIERAKKNINRIYSTYSHIEFVDNSDCKGPEDAGRLWYLGEAIKKLGDCDICYFCKGWRKHKGCLAEMEVCKLYGIKILEEN